MPKLSRWELSDSVIESIVSELHNAFLLLKDEGEALTFLNTLVTPAEIIMISKRLSIARMYLKGENYQTIRNELKVSDGTIARITTRLIKNDVVKRVLNDLEAIEKQRLKSAQTPTQPMDKYFRPTRALETAIISTTNHLMKKVKQQVRHHRLKSKLLR